MEMDFICIKLIVLISYVIEGDHLRKPRYGQKDYNKLLCTETGCADTLWQRNWLCRCATTKNLVVHELWHTNRLCRCVMAQELVVQVCYGTETGYADVLWHRNRLCRCVMAQEQVMQMCYGTETGYADVLWHRNWLFR
jgi:hypothetical protein